MSRAHPVDQGRIPVVFRIGITGHRCLGDPEALVPAIQEALRLLRERIPEFTTPDVVLVAVSSLAEGADRLVARDLLAEPGARLEVVLPLARSDYARDFHDAESRREFWHLLELASRVQEAPAHASREEAYEWAGRRVVDQCDALIAVWDGELSRGRGGTEEIVRYARDRKVPLAWVHTKGDPPVTAEMDDDHVQALRGALSDLHEYNKSKIPHAAFATQQRSQRRDLGLDSAPVAPDDALGQACERAAAWLVPFLVRADVLAVRLQRRFRYLSMATFAMAALAVAVVAIQINFFPHHEWIVGFEVFLLLVLLTVPLLRNKLRFHDRWTSYRFLAERLRSAYFLALAGTGDRSQPPGQSASFSDPSVGWIERALSEIIASRPKVGLASSNVVELRSYLNGHWIGGQVKYHDDAATYNENWEKWLRLATATLFMITLICAVLHTFGLGPKVHVSAALVVLLSISIPAVGAAVHGVETQREHRRHAQRCARMVIQLKQLQYQMNEAQTLPQIRQIAANVERSMREESNDWFGVMRFHDIELIT